MFDLSANAAKKLVDCNTCCFGCFVDTVLKIKRILKISCSLKNSRPPALEHSMAAISVKASLRLTVVSALTEIAFPCF